jgi:hypothetical protein
MNEQISLPQQREHFRLAVTDLQLIFLSCPMVPGQRVEALAV